MRLQVKGSMFVIAIDGSTSTKEMAIPVDEEVKHYQSMFIDLVPDVPVVLTANFVKGLIINAEHRVKVTSGDNLVITARLIHAPEVNATGLTIESIDEELDNGTLTTVATETVTAIPRHKLTISGKNYAYSKLVGTPVIAPFSIDGDYLLIGTSEHTATEVPVDDVTTIDEAGDDIVPPLTTETADAVVNAVNRGFVTAGVSGVFSFAYSDTTHCFTLTSLEPGAVFMNFFDTEFDGRSKIGMTASATLTYGTEDYAGKMVEFLTGDAIGTTGTILSVSGENIYLTAVLNPAPAAGDLYRIYDPAVNNQVIAFFYD